MGNVNPMKCVSITSFSSMSVLVEVCSMNIVGISSSRFLLAKPWLYSSPCFPFRLKKVADWLCLVSPKDIV